MEKTGRKNWPGRHGGRDRDLADGLPIWLLRLRLRIELQPTPGQFLNSHFVLSHCFLVPFPNWISHGCSNESLLSRVPEENTAPEVPMGQRWDGLLADFDFWRTVSFAVVPLHSVAGAFPELAMPVLRAKKLTARM